MPINIPESIRHPGSKNGVVLKDGPLGKGVYAALIGEAKPRCILINSKTMDTWFKPTFMSRLMGTNGLVINNKIPDDVMYFNVFK